MANSVSEERINNKAKEILANLGYVYRTDGDNDPGVIQECTYSAYGLKLAAYDLPGYVYELKDKPGLSSMILNHMKKIRISYRGKMVYDSGRSIHESGIWEEILSALYDKLDVLVEKRDEAYAQNEHAKQIKKFILDPIRHRYMRHISESLEYKEYTKNSSRINSCGEYDTEYHYVITENGNEVFHVVHEGLGEDSIAKYVPGAWEMNAIEAIKEHDRRKAEADEAAGYGYLDQISKLR